MMAQMTVQEGSEKASLITHCMVRLYSLCTFFCSVFPCGGSIVALLSGIMVGGGG